MLPVKIYGSRFLRRESRPSESAILTCRLIDRTIRPLFPANMRRDVQLVITCLSIDEENDPDIFRDYCRIISIRYF